MSDRLFCPCGEPIEPFDVGGGPIMEPGIETCWKHRFMDRDEVLLAMESDQPLSDQDYARADAVANGNDEGVGNDERPSVPGVFSEDAK